MKPQNKFIPNNKNCSLSPNNNSGPILHDSKSFSYLKSCIEDQKKFRQTTFYPTTSKNSNLDFLRYTVNVNRTPAQKPSTEFFPKPKIKLNRKLTQDLQYHAHNQFKEKHSVLWKPQNRLYGSPKKTANPQKKYEKFEDLKNNSETKQAQKNVLSGQITHLSATDRQQVKNKNIPNYISKKTYTPKITKFSNSSSHKQGKIINSYSSINLLKEDHTNSPTSQSISSRLAEKQTKSNPLLQFDKIKYLGEGKFGQVHLVRHKITAAIFALKQIKKESIIKNKMEQQLLMEIKMQMFFNHPNILKLYGFFDDEENIYLILQYMEQGTLYTHLKKQKTLKQAEASRKLRDVIEGIVYLHSMTVAHRDLKPQNIVMSNDVCKICDLGWAAICQDRRKTLCGTIDYASPELLEGKQYGIAIDLWCLGVLCFQLMVGKAPFYHISRKQTMKKIMNADCSDINIPQNMAKQTCDFIGKLLKKNPDQRMSARQALDHNLILMHKEQQLQDFRSSSKRKY